MTPSITTTTASHLPAMVLVQVSNPKLFLCMTPLLIVIGISSRMQLNLERPMLMGTVRTFVQLSILGMILEPIFVRGETCGWIVLAYTSVMVVLAAYEGLHRSKYQFPGMYSAVLLSLVVNVVWVSCFAFLVVLRPDPLWDPQYVIPIVGMLLGNCIHGIALALNSMLMALVEQSNEIEWYLSFGATPLEAARRITHEAVRVGAMPQLNSMAIIGLINIPGMMTGQILGGTSVTQAARYQMLIMYLIAMCSFGTILSEVTMALRAGFDSADRLRTDFFIDTTTKPKNGHTRTFQKKNKKNKSTFIIIGRWFAWISSSFHGCWRLLFTGRKNRKQSNPQANNGVGNNNNTSTNDETTGLIVAAASSSTNINSTTNGHTLPPMKNKIELQRVSFVKRKNTANGSVAKEQMVCRLEITNLTHSFAAPDHPNDENDEDDDDDGDVEDDDENENHTSSDSSYNSHRPPRRRILFEKVAMEMTAGEITLVAGPSGAGKSTFLRLVAGLEPIVGGNGSIQLQVVVNKGGGNNNNNNNVSTTTFDSQRDKTLWRQQVRYVSQYKVDIPGTPQDFIQRITSLHVVTTTSHSSSIGSKSKQSDPDSAASRMTNEVKSLVRAWGMDQDNVHGRHHRRNRTSLSCLDSAWSTLSGGEAQRVIVAIAMASRPRVLLLDESTSALDLESKLLVEHSVLEYCRTYGMSVLWITHDPDQMERLQSSS